MTHSVNIGGIVPEFGLNDRVRKAREYAGLDQTALAEMTGLSRTTIARTEQGRSIPRRPALIAVALATGVNLEWLETGKTPAGDNPDGGSECAIRDSNPEPAGLGPRVLHAA